MSKAAKQSIIILVILLMAAFAFSGVALYEKQGIEKAKASLSRQVDEYQLRETKYSHENKTLQEKVKAAEAAKAELEERLNKLTTGMGDTDAKMKKLAAEREELQKKMDGLQKQRDDLAAQLKKKEEPQVIYKYIEKPGDGKSADSASAGNPALDNATPSPAAGQDASVAGKPAAGKEDTAAAGLSVGDNGEDYWAKVIKAKAELELELENLKTELTKKSVEIVDLKKINSDLQMELGTLQDEKATIERDIKRGKDLSDNLSLALARAENEKKFLNDRIVKINDENSDLRDQVKQLTSTKIALEKSIVRLQDEKKGLDKKLLESENVIQNRIDEIWKIKESLQKDFKVVDVANSGAVELSPIVVSAQGNSPEVPATAATGAPARAPGFFGSVVSVNEDNNFVIVDIGSDKGLKLGDNISVYRGAEYVAGLEVIQVRKDIAAADIKNKVATIQVGDVVR